MQAISAAELLNIWERASAHGPLRRALDLLAAAYPDADPEELAREPVGRRDLRLLDLREALFGPTIASTPFCPECGERLDLKFTVDDVRAPVPERGEQLSVEMGGYHLAFRLPDTLDLASTPAGEGVEGFRRHLLSRCLQRGECDGKPVGAGEIPEEAIDRMFASMSAADPQADLQIALACPACGHRWSVVFDIVSFLWSEIDSWAWRLLGDVHTLAKAYGWNESYVLSLSPQRRRIYLTMAMR